MTSRVERLVSTETDSTTVTSLNALSIPRGASGHSSKLQLPHLRDFVAGASPLHAQSRVEDIEEVNRYTLRFANKPLEDDFRAWHFRASFQRVRNVALAEAAFLVGNVALLTFASNITEEEEDYVTNSFAISFVGFTLILVGWMLLRPAHAQARLPEAAAAQVVFTLLIVTFIRISERRDVPTTTLLLTIYLLHGAVRVTFVVSAAFGPLLLLIFFVGAATYIPVDRALFYVAIPAVFCAVLTIVSRQFFRALRLRFLLQRSSRQRAAEIAQNQHKNRQLLRALYPRQVIPALTTWLRGGDNAESVAFLRKDAAFAFVRIGGYDEVVAKLNESDAFMVLNEIFVVLDSATRAHRGCDKIKTIGSVYMVCSGVWQEHIPGEDSETPTQRIMQLVTVMSDAVQQLNATWSQKVPNVPLAAPLVARIGVNTGPCFAGVLGTPEHPALADCYGDTVNMASRLESTGEYGQIHVSDSVRNACVDRYQFTARQTPIKGKGVITTHMLSLSDASSVHMSLGSTSLPNQALLAPSASATQPLPDENDEKTVPGDGADEPQDNVERNISEVTQGKVMSGDYRIPRGISMAFASKSVEREYLTGGHAIGSLSYLRTYIMSVTVTVCLLGINDIYVANGNTEASLAIRFGLMLPACLATYGVTHARVRPALCRDATVAMMWTLVLAELGRFLLVFPPYDGLDDEFASTVVCAELVTVMILVGAAQPVPTTHVTAMLALMYSTMFAVYLAGHDDDSLGMTLTSQSVFSIVLALFGHRGLEYESRRSFSIFSRLESLNEQLATEHSLSERLLESILPLGVMERLRDHPDIPIADRFRSAGILFCDLVGFTRWAATLSAQELVAHLTKVFAEMDAITIRFGVRRVKVIGDAVLVAAVPDNNAGSVSADDLVSLVHTAFEFHKAIEPLPVNLRIGISVGPCTMGTVGNWRFCYDAFGPAVARAQTLEGLCPPKCVLADKLVQQQIADAVSSSDDASLIWQAMGDAFLAEKRG